VIVPHNWNWSDPFCCRYCISKIESRRPYTYLASVSGDDDLERLPVRVDLFRAVRIILFVVILEVLPDDPDLGRTTLSYSHVPDFTISVIRSLSIASSPI
jgi:hypothetical protein